jgi:hypothetical protein
MGFQPDRRFDSLTEAFSFLLDRYALRAPDYFWKETSSALLVPDVDPKYVFRGECGDFSITLSSARRPSILIRDSSSGEAAVMFCPRCGAEYRQGFFRCSDCDIPLVDQLPADRSVTDPKPSFQTDHPELVVLRTFPTVIEADLAKSPLASVGIDSMVRTNNEGGQSPGLAFSRGVELLVRADDVAAANDMLGLEGLDRDNPELGM